MTTQLYLISYDLNNGKEYPPLTAALNKLGATKILFSEWLVRLSGTTPKAIADHLLTTMDADDSIYVCEVGASAWRSTKADPSQI